MNSVEWSVATGVKNSLDWQVAPEATIDSLYSEQLRKSATKNQGAASMAITGSAMALPVDEAEQIEEADVIESMTLLHLPKRDIQVESLKVDEEGSDIVLDDF